MQQGQSSDATGTRDYSYDVISVVYHALQGAENCEIYAEDAEDERLRSFFRQACDQQRQLANQGKQVLMQCLQNEGASGSSSSAFGFGQPSELNQSSASTSETVSSGPAGGFGGRF